MVVNVFKSKDFLIGNIDNQDSIVKILSQDMGRVNVAEKMILEHVNNEEVAQLIFLYSDDRGVNVHYADTIENQIADSLDRITDDDVLDRLAEYLISHNDTNPVFYPYLNSLIQQVRVEKDIDIASELVSIVKKNMLNMIYIKEGDIPQDVDQGLNSVLHFQFVDDPLKFSEWGERIGELPMQPYECVFSMKNRNLDILSFYNDQYNKIGSIPIKRTVAKAVKSMLDRPIIEVNKRSEFDYIFNFRSNNKIRSIHTFSYIEGENPMVGYTPLRGKKSKKPKPFRLDIEEIQPHVFILGVIDENYRGSVQIIDFRKESRYN